VHQLISSCYKITVHCILRYFYFSLHRSFKLPPTALAVPLIGCPVQGKHSVWLAVVSSTIFDGFCFKLAVMWQSSVIFVSIIYCMLWRTSVDIQEPCYHSETAHCSLFFLRPVTLWLLFASGRGHYSTGLANMKLSISRNILLPKSRLNAKLKNKLLTTVVHMFWKRVHNDPSMSSEAIDFYSFDTTAWSNSLNVMIVVVLRN